MCVCVEGGGAEEIESSIYNERGHLNPVDPHADSRRYKRLTRISFAQAQDLSSVGITYQTPCHVRKLAQC